MNKELEWYEIITELQCNPQDYEPKEIEEMMYELEEKLKPIIALTPPTADEIVKELNLTYSDDYGVWVYRERINEFDFMNIENGHRRLTIGKNKLNCLSNLDLSLSHKITSFFMAEEK